MQQRIGIIGGSGLGQPGHLAGFARRIAHHPGVRRVVHPNIATCHLSDASAASTSPLLGHTAVTPKAKHTIPPSQVNYRANIQALKDAGCSHILATTVVAVGSNHIA